MVGGLLFCTDAGPVVRGPLTGGDIPDATTPVGL
jgi:hypothetical protein